MPTALRDNIRRIRKANGLSAAKAAVRVGMNRVSWSDIENGANPNPTPRTLEKIAAALGVSLAELFVDEKGESVTLE
jgi:transcriptional regulator with XRE-family HTH domain